MAESESEREIIEVPEAVTELWDKFLNESSGPFNIEKSDPITDMMRELAKLTNLCFEHFIRLYAYQNSLAQEDSQEAVPFTTGGMPTTN